MLQTQDFVVRLAPQIIQVTCHLQLLLVKVAKGQGSVSISTPFRTRIQEQIGRTSLPPASPAQA